MLFSDLTTILAVIGSQILLLDIDNFSLEDSSRLVESVRKTYLFVSVT